MVDRSSSRPQMAQSENEPAAGILAGGTELQRRIIAMAESESAIESSQQETRVFPPPEEFSARAHVKSLAEYERLYRESIDQPESFWGRVAGEFHWFKRWDEVLQWKVPHAKWFVGGQTNVAYN